MTVHSTRTKVAGSSALLYVPPETKPSKFLNPKKEPLHYEFTVPETLVYKGVQVCKTILIPYFNVSDQSDCSIED